MTDRELLELAAKAAGMTLTGAGYIDAHNKDNPKYRHPDYEWNPLTDDGDALRLAVKLGLIVDMNGMHTRISYPFETVLLHERHGDDPYAATRCAIVRAAAEIGKRMGDDAALARQEGKG